MQKRYLNENEFRFFEIQALDSPSEHAASVLRAKEYIDQNFAQDICLDEIALIANFSPGYLSKMFKRELGINFVKYLTLVRLENARTLLHSTPQKINSIAKTVGFKKPSRFSTLFYQQYGMYPREYRKLENGKTPGCFCDD